jgi:hypothetical protein
MLNKKPFLETKVGKIVGKMSGSLPDKGVLGVLKNLIDLDEELTPEEKKAAHEALIRAYEAEVSDRDSARNREVEITKSGKIDWLFNITGVVGLSAFAVIIWAILAIEIPSGNKEIFIHTIGIVEGVALSIFGYYFGTSMKDNKKYPL